MSGSIYPQLDTEQFNAPGLAGMPYDAAYAADDAAGVVSESAGLEAGVAVVLDSSPGPVASLVPGYAQKVKLPVDATSIVAGFTIYQAAKEPTSPRFSQYDALSFRKKGRMYALVQNTVNAGDDVYAWFASSGGTKGAIRNDPGTAQAVKVRGAKVLFGGATGAAAVIEVNLPAVSADPGGVETITGIKTATYTANYGEFVQYDTTGGAFPINLPTAVGRAGQVIQMGNATASTTALTATATGGQTINGSATLALTTAHGVKTFRSDGANWYAY